MRLKLIQKIIDNLRGKKKKEDINRSILELKYIHIPAISTHNDSFAQYKNSLRDKTVVILGSAPSLKCYKPIENAIHIGVNHTFLNDYLNLDYLFVQDCLDIGNTYNQEKANNYRPNTYQKFYGYHYWVNCPSEKDLEDAKAKRFYFIDQPQSRFNSMYSTCSSDITTRPLNLWGSVVHAAMEFALWTHPQKIYIVGCDSAATGHYFWSSGNDDKVYQNMRYGWAQLRKFADKFYPDIEIISINPVGLRGMFKDVYTQNYIEQNPDIKKLNPTII